MPKTILVQAPAALEEGFTFDVLVEGKPFTVTVPEGGMEEGEEFEIPYDDNDSQDETIAIVPTPSDQDEDEEYDELGAPYGRWRTHLCSCCDVVTQATFWMAFCCTPVLIAQLLTRLRLNWKGKTDKPEEVSLSYNKILLSFIFALVLGNLPVVGLILVAIYCFVLLLWVGSNTRKYMRQKYKIRSSFLPDVMEDCICMCCCHCCATIQMARHTHNDKQYPGYCCFPTGLEPAAPEIV